MEFDKSRIERLKRVLYSRDESMVPKEKRTPVSEVESSVPKNWGEDPSFEFSPEQMSKKNNSFFNKFFFSSVVFFILSLILAIFIFFGGLNLISSSNVDIKVTGPSTIASGEELDFIVSIVNSNRTDLENTVLSLEYPDGTRNAFTGEIINRERVEIGNLGSNSSTDRSFRVSMFGEKDSIKPIGIRVNYNVSDSNALFSKEKTYEIVINSSPIILNVNYPKEINSGQDIDLVIDITSNSVVPIENALVKIEYPYGFTYKDSSLKPFRDDALWNLGTLQDGQKKTLRVTGSLLGQNLEDRSFRVSVGSMVNNLNLDFDTDLAVEQVTIGIRRSFFNLSLKKTKEFYNLGENVSSEIFWQNTLPERISNAKLEVVFSGNAFDRNGVSVGSGGFFRSLDNTITWDKNTNGNLSEILSGVEGRFSFSNKSISNIDDIRSVKNPRIDMKIKMSGERVSSGETIFSEENVTIKFSSLLNLNSRSYRTIAGTSNSGPLPPKADQETTYTIAWTLTNTVNDVSGVVVSAILPVYASWKGEVTPDSESISYDPDTRRVTWNVGNVSFGTGFIYSPKQVFFKVGITPSVNQVGSSPEIIGPSSVSGNDTYTGQNLSAGTPPVNTLFIGNDFVPGYEKVVN